MGAYVHYLDGTPHRIDIDRLSDHKELTAAHEFGHFIDHAGIGTPGMYASESDDLLKGWRHAISRTDGYNELKESRKKAQGDDLKHINYLLTQRELWARSYAQYIAIRSCDPHLLEQLGRLQKTQVSQWYDDDFEPVAAEIDKLFRGLGWLKKI